MAGFNDVLKSIGFGVGVVTGGPSQVKAITGAVGAQGKISSYLDSVGRKLGGIVGPDLFEKIAGGARVTGDKETAAFVDSKILTETTRTKITWIAVLGLLVVGFFFYRGKA